MNTHDTEYHYILLKLRIYVDYNNYIRQLHNE